MMLATMLAAVSNKAGAPSTIGMIITYIDDSLLLTQMGNGINQLDLRGAKAKYSFVLITDCLYCSMGGSSVFRPLQSNWNSSTLGIRDVRHHFAARMNLNHWCRHVARSNEVAHGQKLEAQVAREKKNKKVFF
jgi:hypothetical protein